MQTLRTSSTPTKTPGAAVETQSHVARFDAAFCGKVVRVAAAVCVVEFLSMIALLMMWVPADSKCRELARAGEGG
jgi:hypothetical protein